MDTMNELAKSLKNNKELSDLEKELIVDFVGDLEDIRKKTGGIDYNNLINNLKDLKILNVEDGKTSGYSTKDNVIYLDKKMIKDNWKSNLYKALLQCSITNREGNKIKYGIVDPNGGNYALNEAITQRFLDLMLGSSEKNILDFEMNIYAKIQEIIGLDKVFDAYFKADYGTLALEFENYKTSLPLISLKYDRLMSLNLDSIDVSLGDRRLVSDIERLLINAYAHKIINNDVDKESIDRFRNNIITSGSVKAYDKDNKEMYDGINSNITYFNMLLNGLKISRDSSKIM